MMTIAWPTVLDEEAVFAARKLAVQLVEYACDGDRGRSETDPIYTEITEGRDVGAMRRRYSSCADLAFWMLFRLGVRLPLVNRHEHRGWRVGMNVAMLVGARECRPVLATERLKPGDIVVVWNRQDTQDAHVLVVIDHERDTLLTAEYGQPGGALKMRHFRAGLIGSRRAQRIIPLASVLRSAHLKGLLEPAEDPTRAEDGSSIWTPGVIT